MNKYEIILDVCETHSISKTAEKLNYTQSAISQAIRSYEKELGFPLFKRSKSGMDLLLGTEEIIESLRIICREEQQINRLAARLNGLDTGYIRIGTIQSIAYHWLPDILKEFSSVYPNINFELTVDGFSGLKERPTDSNDNQCGWPKPPPATILETRYRQWNFSLMTSARSFWYTLAPVS